MRTSNRLAPPFAAAVFLFASLGFALASAAVDSTVLMPMVRAAPHGQQGFPFIATTLNLGKVGYVEQEFLVSGTARAYIPVAPLQPDGRWNVKPNPGSPPRTQRGFW